MPLLKEAKIWGKTIDPKPILQVKRDPSNLKEHVTLIPTEVDSCLLEIEDKVYFNPDSFPFRIYATACANCPFNPSKAVNHCQAVQLPK